MNLYFFGCADPVQKGHYLFDIHRRSMRDYESKHFPFKYTICDGGLLTDPQDQGRLHLAHINGWTIISCWDRTGDKRGGSCASFIADAFLSMDEMERAAQQAFPALWERIMPYQIRKATSGTPEPMPA